MLLHLFTVVVVFFNNLHNYDYQKGCFLTRNFYLNKLSTVRVQSSMGCDYLYINTIINTSKQVIYRLDCGCEYGPINRRFAVRGHMLGYLMPN